MITKTLVMGMYETSLQNKLGIPLTEGWKEISDSYTESETKSLFADLSNDFLSGSPSLRAFEENELLSDDALLACYFADLAGYTTMYGRFWSDMAIAYLLKKKLTTSAPSEVDIRLGSYLLSVEGFSGEPLRNEIESWSNAENWKPTENDENTDFPEEWWDQFTINYNEFPFPRTILLMLEACYKAGTMDTALPETVSSWIRFSQVVDQIFE